jgi:hypothetical protein
LINQIFVNYSCQVNNAAILMGLKELEKSIADTEREIEQLRFSLTTSTPQQEIDLLTRILPAQTDDQGIDLNNEISVSM